MEVPTLRQALNEWATGKGLPRKLGRELPDTWLGPLAYSHAEPVPEAERKGLDVDALVNGGDGDGDEDGDGEGEDDEFGDEGLGDDDDEFGDDGSDDGEGGAAGRPDKVIGCSDREVHRGIALNTLQEAITRFSVKNAEMKEQMWVLGHAVLRTARCDALTSTCACACACTCACSCGLWASRLHAKQTKMFADFEHNMGEFKELFDELDTSNTGTIDRQELEAGLVKKGHDWLLPLPYVPH